MKGFIDFPVKPYILDTACVAGKREAEGPLRGLFDFEDDVYGKYA